MDNQSTKESLVHPFPKEAEHHNTEGEMLPYKKVAMIFVITIVIGILSGFVVQYVASAFGSKTTTAQKTTEKKSVKEAVGIPDKKTFKDSAEGELVEGGSEGEGSFHLERPGGESQNVYLTSSTVDMSEYIGSQVRVHGETFESDKVGWLMDVGYIEILE